MSTTIKCPNCRHEFAMEEAVSEQYKKDLREQMVSFTRKKEEEFQKKAIELSKQLLDQEEVFQKKLNEEKKIIQQSLEENLRKTIHGDFENRLSILQQSNEEQQEKLKTARQKELEFLQKEQAFKNKEEELEISTQRKLQEERIKIAAHNIFWQVKNKRLLKRLLYQFLIRQNRVLYSLRVHNIIRHLLVLNGEFLRFNVQLVRALIHQP